MTRARDASAKCPFHRPFEQLFEQFVPECLDWLRKNKALHVTPLMDFAMVETLCSILGVTLTAAQLPPDQDKEAVRLTIEASFQVTAAPTVTPSVTPGASPSTPRSRSHT